MHITILHNRDHELLELRRRRSVAGQGDRHPDRSPAGAAHHAGGGADRRPSRAVAVDAVAAPAAAGELSPAEQAAGWRTPDGCATCRPAINYYLISTWPKETRDDPQSRLVNERSHANIQKDGTYSVIPAMPAGEVTPEQLLVFESEVGRWCDPVDDTCKAPSTAWQNFPTLVSASP